MRTGSGATICGKGIGRGCTGGVGLRGTEGDGGADGGGETDTGTGAGTGAGTAPG